MTPPRPYYAPIRLNGVAYDLGHLDPVRFSVISDKLQRAVTIRCRFTNHVFTRAFNATTDDADVPLFEDGLRPRVFCHDRYQLSHHLPTAVLKLCDGSIKVRETSRQRNWLYVAVIDVAQVDYQIFFNLKRATKTAAEREDVEMVVESAYAFDPKRPPNLRGKASFMTLAVAATENRQVHTQPSRKR